MILSTCSVVYYFELSCCLAKVAYRDCLLVQESLKSEVNSIRSVLAVHHRIMSEMRAILKAMAKVGWCLPVF